MLAELNKEMREVYIFLQERYKAKHGHYYSGDIVEPIPPMAECPYCATGQGILCSNGHIKEQFNFGNLSIRV